MKDDSKAGIDSMPWWLLMKERCLLVCRELSDCLLAKTSLRMATPSPTSRCGVVVSLVVSKEEIILIDATTRLWVWVCVSEGSGVVLWRRVSCDDATRGCRGTKRFDEPPDSL